MLNKKLHENGSKDVVDGKDEAQLMLLKTEDVSSEDLAPNGGWGWMIALAMIVIFITTIGPAICFTIIFGDFLNSTGQAGSATTLLNSVFMVSFSFSGLLTNTLLKKYSIRPVGLIGSIIFVIPNIVIAGADHIYQMCIIFFLQGIGLGVMITVCNINFNAYFVKKRATVMTVTQVIIGIGSIAYPIFIEKSMRVYGFRGTSALIGALSLNCIAAMLVMHPVEWHMKNPEEIRKENALLEKKSHINPNESRLPGQEKMRKDGRRSSGDYVKTNAARWASLRSLKEGANEIPLLVETLKLASQSRVASSAEIDGVGPTVTVRSKSGSHHDLVTKRLSMLSAASMTSLTSTAALGDIQNQYQRQKERSKIRSDTGIKKADETRTKGFVSTMANFFEVSLFKDWKFINTCTGISFVFASEYAFSSFLPLIMNDAGYSKSEAAYAVTIGAVAELVSRIFLAFFTMLVDVRAKYIFFVAMIVVVFAKLSFLCYQDTLMGIFITSAAISFIRSWFFTTQPLVVIENFSSDKFAAAYGVFTIISGAVNIISGPFVDSDRWV
ncbi:uncharacterized protein LOC107267625 isoform X2 [Cephus cinctus]|uniref:Uncharacterized protein LOC107267625 isoform X2 n=1 Tax=Cephus cinctus TaxID=211228 RepID=A0AAJ7RHU5_CEPCN|nr:uncharacterized protein LOC107267625 isoform X2 [Cephus cinctus]